jgi:hypothetical protein
MAPSRSPQLRAAAIPHNEQENYNATYDDGGLDACQKGSGE